MRGLFTRLSVEEEDLARREEIQSISDKIAYSRSTQQMHGIQSAASSTDEEMRLALEAFVREDMTSGGVDPPTAAADASAPLAAAPGSPRPQVTFAWVQMSHVLMDHNLPWTPAQMHQAAEAAAAAAAEAADARDVHMAHGVGEWLADEEGREEGEPPPAAPREASDDRAPPIAAAGPAADAARSSAARVSANGRVADPRRRRATQRQKQPAFRRSSGSRPTWRREPDDSIPHDKWLLGDRLSDKIARHDPELAGEFTYALVMRETNETLEAMLRDDRLLDEKMNELFAEDLELRVEEAMQRQAGAASPHTA